MHDPSHQVIMRFPWSYSALLLNSQADLYEMEDFLVNSGQNMFNMLLKMDNQHEIKLSVQTFVKNLILIIFCFGV